VQIGQQVLGYLRVSHPWFEVTKPIRQLIFDLSLGSALMLLRRRCGGSFQEYGAGAVLPTPKQFTADASRTTVRLP